MNAEEVEIQCGSGDERGHRLSIERLPCRNQVAHRFWGAARGHSLESDAGPAVGCRFDDVDVARLVLARISRIAARDPVELADGGLLERQVIRERMDEAKSIAVAAHLFLIAVS